MVISLLLIADGVPAIVIVDPEALGFDGQNIIGPIAGLQAYRLPRQGQAAVVVIGLRTGGVALLPHHQQGLGLEAQGDQAAFRPVSGVGPGH